MAFLPPVVEELELDGPPPVVVEELPDPVEAQILAGRDQVGVISAGPW